MDLYGLIGYPLSHSFSKKYFSEKFDKLSINAQYELFPIENIELFKEIITLNPNLKGFNVTIPYKEQIGQYLTDISIDAKEVGSINTIKIVENRLIGFNTDYIGFQKTLLPLLNSNVKKAAILGTGGSSKAVIYVLKKLGIEYTSVSRIPSKGNEINYEDINNIISSFQLIINTTPIGMFPNINDVLPLNFKDITPSTIAYDLIYNPDETMFLQNCKKSGCITKNGLEMLIIQAEEAWKIWNTNIKA